MRRPDPVGTPRTRRRDKLAPDPTVRREILAAASTTLREQGVRGVSIAAVLERASLGTRAFYRHFDSKDELVAALFLEDGGRHDSLMDLDWPAREGAAYYSALMNDETCLVALARDGGDVIGHLIGRLSGPDSLRTGRVAVLESMRVASGSRRAGTGSLLVRHFLTWARDGGAQQASVTAYAANDAAQRFYARHGFRPKSVTSRAIL